MSDFQNNLRASERKEQIENVVNGLLCTKCACVNCDLLKCLTFDQGEIPSVNFVYYFIVPFV